MGIGTEDFHVIYCFCKWHENRHYFLFADRRIAGLNPMTKLLAARFFAAAFADFANGLGIALLLFIQAFLAHTIKHRPMRIHIKMMLLPHMFIQFTHMPAIHIHDIATIFTL